MKIKFLFAALLLGALSASADKVPCLVFTGAAEGTSSHDMSVYNRVMVGEEGFTVKSSTNPDAEEIELPYALYNHIEFKDDNPTTQIESVAAAPEAGSLVYSAADNSLNLTTGSDRDFAVGIYDLSGALVARAELGRHRTLSLSGLAKGTYIALATDGAVKITAKFIIR